MVDENIILSPVQSLALRRMIDAMKADDRIYNSCPEVIRSAFSDFYMPPYTTAEEQIRALLDASDAGFRRLEKFALKIKEQEAQIAALRARPTALIDNDRGRA